MIETYLLEQLVAFSKYGTLSAASEQLHLSQPALSRSMRKLEELLEVTLFERNKNKITLNENGVLATEYAAKILEQQHDMIERVRAFDRSRHTITLGACAPMPIWLLLPILTQTYPEMTLASEIKPDDFLLKGLREGAFQLVVLHEKPDDASLVCQYLGSEQLYLSLPPAHPLAGYQSLHLKDLEGQTMLLYSQIGFWYDFCMEKMPHVRFLMQHEMDVFGELVNASALPCFTTDLAMKQAGLETNRKAIPLVDKEAAANYYCVCLPNWRERLASFFKQVDVYSNFAGEV